MRVTLLRLGLLLLSVLSTGPASAEGPSSQGDAVMQRTVNVIRAEGTVTPVMAEWISQSLVEAEADDAEALIISLDTPGGLDTSMRVIIKDVLASSVPVIVFVSPTGARAASAGVFITLAGHVAAMAPGTNIGAAHPVNMGGKMDDTVAEKVTNDAAAYIRSLAEQRGRNADWAEEAVRASVSLPATEALKLGVVDLVAEDIDHLLSAVDGREVETAAGARLLSTRDVRIDSREMPRRLRILSFLTDPNIAYILLLLGIYGIFFEIMNPGAVFPGVLGTICLLIGLYSLQALPVDYAGILLIVLGVILFILEIKITSYGLLSLGGIACLVVGSLMLFKSAAPVFRLSLFVLIPGVGFSAGLFIITVWLVARAQRARIETGAESLVGMEGRVVADFIDGSGPVRVHGELWTGGSSDPLRKGDVVVVEAVLGLVLSVRRKERIT